MPRPLIRIFSDVHYGDQVSRVRRLASLRPLAGDADRLVLNGDTLDTRPGPRPEHTLASRAAVLAFAHELARPVTFITGNHDPDFSTQHALELAEGRVVALHGDVVFEDIVPWGRDSPVIRAKIAAALAAETQPLTAAARLALWRRVAATIPQRHQSEANPLKYAFRLAADTVWPPLRVFRVLRAWRRHGPLAAGFAREHWPRAKFILIGHTHRPGVLALPDGRVVINTGSFTPPLGGYAVDVFSERLLVRRVEPRGGDFVAGASVAEFPLADA